MQNDRLHGQIYEPTPNAQFVVSYLFDTSDSVVDMKPIPVPPGTRLGRWTVLGVGERLNGKESLMCLCDCGAIKTIKKSYIRLEKSRSCGCLANELASERMKIRTTHSMSKRSEYRIWVGFKARCQNKNDRGYMNYGGRGISVCERWLTSFENFYADMGDRPPGMSIDRIDNNIGYSPENCRWATLKQQARNKRCNALLELEGQMITIAEFSERTGIPDYLLHQRRQKGFSGGEILEIYRGRYSPAACILALTLAGAV